MPTCSHLASNGLSTTLRSCTPPITVPAWSVMATGLDPGCLGVYGFRNRADRSYHRRRLASSWDIQHPTLWSWLSQHNIKSLIMGVPQTYPPQPILGTIISGPLTPHTNKPISCPKNAASLASSVTNGRYRTDIDDFRHLPLERLYSEIVSMTQARFSLARHLLEQNDWDVFMMVEIGLDRIHHGFWNVGIPDATNSKSEFASTISDYHALLDHEIAGLLTYFNEEDLILIVSDHGAQANEGCFAINQWLLENDYLSVKTLPTKPVAVHPDQIDWNKTTAWADGGYIARIYVNVRGRELQGQVSPENLDSFLQNLSDKLSKISPPWKNQIDRPKDIYQEVNGIAPDLIVAFDELRRRPIGSIGHPTCFVSDNDLGRDHANHSYDGVLIMRDNYGARTIPQASIYDIAPTIMDRLEVNPPPGMQGTVIT